MKMRNCMKMRNRIMPKTELTTMVMIENPATGEVLVQDRLLSWKGLSFPGGHVDDGESVYDCAVREVLEETGLAVRDLKPCGMVHWCNLDTRDRYFVFLFKTQTYSGTLIPEMEEGRHAWMSLEALRRGKCSPYLDQYLPLFLEEKHSEVFGPWREGEDRELEYKGGA